MCGGMKRVREVGDETMISDLPGNSLVGLYDLILLYCTHGTITMQLGILHCTERVSYL
jgi:hypothetical protein